MPRKFYPKELKEEIISKIKTEGITAVEAAKRYGIDVNNIYRWVSAGVGGAKTNLWEINWLKNWRSQDQVSTIKEKEKRLILS